VSALLHSNFKLRCVRIDERAERSLFEALLIGTLSLCPVRKPPDQWLGVYAYSDHVQSSGLWNSQFISGWAQATIKPHRAGRATCL
jgi:hypothetical protein